MLTYEKLLRRISEKDFASAGKSVWGRELYYYRVGNGKRKLFINGTHHGNEYITAEIALDFHDYIKNRVKNWSIFVLPMVNPDGVAICQGLLPKNTEAYERIRRLNGWKDLYRVWRKNANGVDLNHNYDALFKSEGVFGGAYPESEPESRAVVNLVKKENFDMVICLHAQGEEIYHGFRGVYPEGSEKIAEAMAKVSGYALAEPSGTASFGGMKDWFTHKFSRPGFTVEVGKGKNPIPEEQLSEIEERLFPAIEKAMLTYEEVLC